MATPTLPAESSNGRPPGRQAPTGRSGTVNVRGWIEDREFNNRLRWPLNLDEYEKMRRTDPTVQWMLRLVSTPLRAALWSVQPPENPSPVELEATCFAQHAIFSELDGGFDQHLRQALTYLDFGHSVFERSAELRPVEFDVDAGDEGEPTHVKRDAFVLAALDPRLQRTIQRWNVDPAEPKRLLDIKQWLADGHQPSVTTIEADRLVIYVGDKEGDDWRGVSLLRSAWKSWFTKSQLQNLEAIAFERSAGFPVVYPPPDADDDDLTSVEEAIKKVKQGENVWMIMPGPKQLPARGGGQPAEEWLVEDLAINASAGQAADFGAAIGRYDLEMAKNVMASFMELGQKEVGARATADVQQDPYYQALAAHASYIEDTFSEAVLAPLCDWNYTLERYPRLVCSKLQAKNAEVIAAAVKGLIEAGAMQADEPLEDFLRDLLDAPDADPDYEEEEEEPPPVQVVPMPAANASQAGGTQGAGEPGTGGAPGMAASQPKRRLWSRFRRGGKGTNSDPIPALLERGDYPLNRHQVEAIERSESFSQFIPSRPLRGVEHHVAWQQVADTLDNAQLDIVAIGERVMEGQLGSLQASADEAVERADIAAIEALKPDPRPLAEALEAELLRIYATGQADVRAEVRRQQDALKAEGRTAMAAERRAGEPPDIPLSKAEIAAIIAALAASMADTGSQAATQAIRQRALKALAQRARTEAAPGEDPLAQLRAALRQSAPLASNRVYGMGRMDEIQTAAARGLIEVVIRSAVLDNRCCDVCEGSDGESFRPEVAPPLPDGSCEGGDRCRCQYLPELMAPSETSVP
jgi:hypothetical protein